MMPRGSDELLPAPLSARPDALTQYDGRFELPPDDEEGSELNVGRYVNALLRHKWLMLGLSVVGFGAGFAASRVVKPVYETQATIQIVGAPRAQQQGPIQSTRLFEARGWIELSRSFQILDEVVLRRRLFIMPSTPVDSGVFADFELADTFTSGQYVLTSSAAGERLTLAGASGAVVESAAPGEPLGAAAGFVWTPRNVPAGATIEFRVVPPRDAAVMLGNTLETIPPPENGSFLKIQMRGTDPHAIAATINATADRFVEVATQLKRADLTNRTEVLRAQLSRSQSELTAADNALESYRIRTITLPSDRGATPITPGLAETRDPVFDAFNQLRLEREALENDRDGIRRALEAPADSESDLSIALGTIPSVRAAPELMAALTELGVRRAEVRRMAARFTSAHPPLRQLEQEVATLERDVVRAQARSLLNNLELRIADYGRRIEASGREMQQIPPRVSEEARRRRDFQSAQEIHASLREAYDQARLAELSAAPDVRVLDFAVPPTTPVQDRLLFIIVGGFVGGLGLGVVLALLLDRFDSRIRYPDQVTRELGLQILGALPFVRTDARGAIDADGAAHLLESLRSIRMNMVYSHGSAGPFITTITSPGSGEGKSFLSANLAKSFADSGHRALLIDGDTRRGVLHRTLGGFRKPGLLDYLSGGATMESVTQHIASHGVDFIACGTRSSGGPEMLASAGMAQMLMALRSKYSAIIIDSPPLGAGVDPLVLASLCGSMVLMLRNGVSDRDLAEAKLGELQRLPIRLLGAVLNDVKPQGIYRYYSYLPGYRAEDEVTSAAASRAILPGRK